MSKAIGASEINKQLEVEIGKNIRDLKRGRAALPTGEGQQSADDLGLLFRQITERSTREVERLIDELHGLRKKLENDGDLIERAIEQHSQFSQGARQLTTMIADNVKRLPQPSS